MSDQNQTQNANQEPQEQKDPSFSIQRVYLKDASIEQPNSPLVFLDTGEPEVEIEVNVSAIRLDEIAFEVTVMATLQVKKGEKIALLIEAQQAGIFALEHIPEEHIEPLLSINCTTILYPYLRANIADLVGRAGFQPIHMSEINFQALYEQRLAQTQVQVQATPAA